MSQFFEFEPILNYKQMPTLSFPFHAFTNTCWHMQMQFLAFVLFKKKFYLRNRLQWSIDRFYSINNRLATVPPLDTVPSLSRCMNSSPPDRYSRMRYSLPFVWNAYERSHIKGDLTCKGEFSIDRSEWLNKVSYGWVNWIEYILYKDYSSNHCSAKC